MLAKRGMPTGSVDAANAWRAVNAPPRNRKDKADRPSPRPESPPVIAKSVSRSSAPPPRQTLQPQPAPEVSNDTVPVESASTPELSVKRAVEAEDAAHAKRKWIEINNGSIEDYRKANAVYIAARNNRVKAERDFSEWERLQQITIFTTDAIEMFQRTIGAGRQMIDVMPKTMSSRLVGQPQKVIERTLLEWTSRLIETMRSKVWPKELPS